MLPYVTTTIGYGNDTLATEKSCFSKLTGLMNEQRRFFNTQIFHKSTISVNFPQNKMKICAACCEELPKEGFSSKQWKLKQYQRRCIDNRSILAPLNKVTENQTQQPSSADNDGKDAPSCWICLEEGDNELGQPLRRDYS